MKQQYTAFCFLAVLSVLPLTEPASRAQDFTVDTFTSEEDVGRWTRWWGAAAQTYEFDPAVDAANDASSGSLKATIEFDLATYGGDNQFALIGAFPDGATIDGTLYTNLVFDLRWDPASAKRSNGDYGSLEFGFRKADFGQLWLSPPSPITLTSAIVDVGWLHVEAPIDPAAAGVDALTGVVLKLWSGDPNTGQTGTSTFWVDNVRLIAKTNLTVPSLTLSIEPATPGFRIFASAAGSQYQRQNIRTINPEYSWVGATEPVTYSFTIGDYPGTNNTGFQTHLFLVPGDSIANFESSPDYNQPHLIFLDLQNNADGGAFATFRYKTNQPAGNTMIYNGNPTNGPVGSLAGIGSAQIEGTWSLTFSNDTSVTLTTPEGSSTNFVFPAESAALFAGPLYAYLGIQPNQIGNINQSALFTKVEIIGVPTPITENFEGVQPDPETPLNLDPAIWERVAENAPGLILVPPGSSYWVNWTVPASGFALQVSPDLTSWTDLTVAPTQIGNQMRTLLPASALPQGRSAFFRVAKPE